MPQEALLIRTLVELADNLIDDFDVVDVLSVLSDRCVETLGVASAGVMLATRGGELQLLASSSDAMRTLELFELQAQEGPCVDCYRSAAAVSASLDARTATWPRFGPQAVAQGIHSVDALPMRLRGRTIGALNLFRTGPGAMDPADLMAAQALADVSTIAILQHWTALGAQALNDQLSEALRSRIIIEQAKGKMSEAIGLEMDEAFERLRSYARRHNLRLTDLCRRVVEGRVPTGELAPLRPPG